MKNNGVEPDWAEMARLFRHSRGLLQKQAAFELGVDVMTVSRWERGVTIPAPDKRRILLEALAEINANPKDTRPAPASGLAWSQVIRQIRQSSGMSLAHLASLVQKSPETVKRWEVGEEEPSQDVKPFLRDLIANRRDPLHHPLFDLIKQSSPSVAIYSLTTGKFLYSRDEKRLLGDRGTRLEGQAVKKQASSFAHESLETAGGFPELRRPGVLGYEITQCLNGGRDDFQTVSTATIVRLEGYAPVVVINRRKELTTGPDSFKLFTEADLPD